jgi:hypothetical protein
MHCNNAAAEIDKLKGRFVNLHSDQFVVLIVKIPSILKARPCSFLTPKIPDAYLYDAVLLLKGCKRKSDGSKVFGKLWSRRAAGRMSEKKSAH